MHRMYLGHVNHFGHTQSYSYVTLVTRKVVSVHLEIVLISAQDKCTVCTEYNTGVEIALGTPGWYSMVMYVKLKLVLVHLGIVLVSACDRCIVCAERTIGSEIILAAPDDTPRDEGQVKAHFGAFGDSVKLDA